jgi:hypothetical protein
VGEGVIVIPSAVPEPAPLITLGLFLVPLAMLPAVPLEAVEDPTVKVLPPWVMLILAILLLLPPPPVPAE